MPVPPKSAAGKPVSCPRNKCPGEAIGGVDLADRCYWDIADSGEYIIEWNKERAALKLHDGGEVSITEVGKSYGLNCSKGAITVTVKTLPGGDCRGTAIIAPAGLLAPIK